MDINIEKTNIEDVHEEISQKNNQPKIPDLRKPNIYADEYAFVHAKDFLSRNNFDGTAQRPSKLKLEAKLLRMTHLKEAKLADRRNKYCN